MEHEKTDENSKYLEACENVKKIVNAIKLIKIKYYPNFEKITDEDKKVYEKLELNLEKISSNNNLNKLKVALMEEVSAKYDKKDIKQINKGNPNYIDKVLLACYGAVDAQQKALLHGKIKRARQCQNILKEYLEQLDLQEYKELVVQYKRKKFSELTKNNKTIQEENEAWLHDMKAFFKTRDAKERKKVLEEIETKYKANLGYNFYEFNNDTEELQIV